MGSHVADGRMEVSWMTRMTCLLVKHLAALLVSQGATWEASHLEHHVFVGTKTWSKASTKRQQKLHFLTTQQPS